MHIALDIAGFGALFFLFVMAYFIHADKRSQVDDWGYAVEALLSGFVAALFGGTWLLLIFVKAATA